VCVTHTHTHTHTHARINTQTHTHRHGILDPQIEFAKSADETSEQPDANDLASANYLASATLETDSILAGINGTGEGTVSALRRKLNGVPAWVVGTA